MARRGDGPPKATPLKAAARPERQIAFQLGISAESRAAALLIAKGFRILARRWKSPAGEIDIVARRRHLLIFVEVKARAHLDEAAESVNVRQQRRIAAAAEVWLAGNPDDNLRDFRLMRSWWRPANCRATSRRRSRRIELTRSAARRTDRLVRGCGRRRCRDRRPRS